MPKSVQPAKVVQSAEIRPGTTARALLLLLRVYQTYLSPMNFSSCRFYPSCSHYAGEAVQRFGARRGVWLAMKRLARCQPFSKGGFDPVPDIATSSRTSTQVANDETKVDGAYRSSRAHSRQGDTASAVSFSPYAIGVLTPEGLSHSSDSPDHRATRGQEFAQ